MDAGRGEMSLCMCECLYVDERDTGREKSTWSSSSLPLRYMGRDLTQHLVLGTPPKKDITHHECWRAV